MWHESCQVSPSSAAHILAVDMQPRKSFVPRQDVLEDRQRDRIFVITHVSDASSFFEIDCQVDSSLTWEDLGQLVPCFAHHRDVAPVLFHFDKLKHMVPQVTAVEEAGHGIRVTAVSHGRESYHV